MKEKKLIELLDICLEELCGDSTPRITRKIAITHALNKLRRAGIIDRFKVNFTSVLPEVERLKTENEKLRVQLNKRGYK